MMRAGGLLLLFFATLATAAEPFNVAMKVKHANGREGTVVLEIRPDWAPIGVKRFQELIDQRFFEGCRFFRVVSGFMAQFGINGDPSVSAMWRDNKIPDDDVKQHNKRGMITFATSGANSRTTQMFINLVDNSRLDSMGFAPFGKVVMGMEHIDRLYSGYGEGAPQGRGPDQGLLQRRGNAYLAHSFPKLSWIVQVEKMENAREEQEQGGRAHSAGNAMAFRAFRGGEAQPRARGPDLYKTDPYHMHASDHPLSGLVGGRPLGRSRYH